MVKAGVTERDALSRRIKVMSGAIQHLTAVAGYEWAVSTDGVHADVLDWMEAGTAQSAAATARWAANWRLHGTNGVAPALGPFVVPALFTTALKPTVVVPAPPRVV